MNYDQVLLDHVDMGARMQNLVIIHTKHGLGAVRGRKLVLTSTKVVDEGQSKTGHLGRALHAKVANGLESSGFD